MLPDDYEQDVRRVPVYHKHRTRNHFHGWRWTCPACEHEVKMLFFPLPVPSIVRYLEDEKRFVTNDADALPEPAPTFACHDCHNIRYFSSTIHSSWNHVVAYLSGGLLYGREVARAEWFQVKRKRAYRKHNVPMVRGAEVERHLLNGLKYDDIAKEMKIALATVQGHVRRLYRARGVHSRKQLIELAETKKRMNHEDHEGHEDSTMRIAG
jgi:DNA-binding CsgD family transcriptional regulator